MEQNNKSGLIEVHVIIVVTFGVLCLMLLGCSEQVPKTIRPTSQTSEAPMDSMPWCANFIMGYDSAGNKIVGLARLAVYDPYDTTGDTTGGSATCLLPQKDIPESNSPTQRGPREKNIYPPVTIYPNSSIHFSGNIPHRLSAVPYDLFMADVEAIQRAYHTIPTETFTRLQKLKDRKHKEPSKELIELIDRALHGKNGYLPDTTVNAVFEKMRRNKLSRINIGVYGTEVLAWEEGVIARVVGEAEPLRVNILHRDEQYGMSVSFVDTLAAFKGSRN